jgi:exonuclease 3'-5' domain-containing protein 1
MIDIHRFGAAAFTTPASSPTTKIVVATAVDDVKADVSQISLKSLLESLTIPKVFFDVRNDSDAPFAHFGIKLSCMHDLQLMELATTNRPSRDYLTGLASCIAWDAGISYSERMRVQSVKEHGNRLFAPERGGSYKVFEERLLREGVREYYVVDVVHMPKLWKVYYGRMDAMWRVMVREAAERRVEESQSAGYVSTGEHKRLGCWSEKLIKQARKRWEGGVKSGLCD